MDKCCPRVDVVSTHWEGCHEHHPECAAYQSGYEAGLRRAVEIGNEITSGYYQHAKAPYGHYQQSILAEIKGE